MCIRDSAEAHHIPLKINRETNYSKDKNLWHLSHEGLDLESPANEPQYNKPGFLELGVSPEQAPDTPTYITLHFEKGIPTAVDGKEMGAVAVSYTHLDVYKRQHPCRSRSDRLHQVRRQLRCFHQGRRAG